jgi:2-amino-4-hydroxy-6-hydroxymethyldihydropteridine diphosphokinase
LFPVNPAIEQPVGDAVRAFVALGSNLGDRRAHLDFALSALGDLPLTSLGAVSGIVETEPVGSVPQGRYLNAAAEVRTGLSPRRLLESLLEIERSRGRDRARELQWGPRTLDLDLLLYGDRMIDEPGLTVPHPRLHERLFVLVPLAQVAGGTLVPGHGRSVTELLRVAQLSHEAAEQSRGKM